MVRAWMERDRNIACPSTICAVHAGLRFCALDTQLYSDDRKERIDDKLNGVRVRIARGRGGMLVVNCRRRANSKHSGIHIIRMGA